MTEPALVLTILGSGDAFSSGGHPYSSYILEPAVLREGEPRAVLLDCGPTTVPSLKGMGYDLSRIDMVLISHFHGDHIAGMPFLYLEYQYMTGRDRPLIVAGPPGVEERMESLYRFMYGSQKWHFDAVYQELNSGRKREIAGLAIHPFEVIHSDAFTCYAFRIRWHDRTLAWSGDSGWTEALVEAARGSNLFLCECAVDGSLSHTQLKVRNKGVAVHSCRLA